MMSCPRSGASVPRRSLLAATLGLGLIAMPSIASADAWTGDHCAIAGWSAPNAQVCVKGYVGGKNTGNRTQWVGQVRVFTRYAGLTSAGTRVLEGWGDGFYKSISYPTSSSRYVERSVTWQVNRWVRSGTNVCGARTFFSLYPRAVTCFSIRV